MPRTDIHRPSVIIPEDYDYVGLECIKIESVGDVFLTDELRKEIKRHMTMTGGEYARNHSAGNCHICGAHCIYTVVFHHRPSNSYIRTGSDCADKLDMSYNTGAMNAFRTACKEAMELHAGKKKAQAILADANLSAAWGVYMTDYSGSNNFPPNEEMTIREMVGKLVRFGSISDKQIAFLGALLNRIDERAVIEAKRQAEKDAAAPVPTGKIAVEGVVVATKSVETMYGDTLKMVVLSDDGWKVFGSIPDCLYSGGHPIKGCRVRFNATVEASPTDDKFGFFKRPTKAVFVSVPEEYNATP
jgi:hypothetical protein